MRRIVTALITIASSLPALAGHRRAHDVPAPASCTPGNPSADPCSTVNKQALLILAGRALNGVLRPTGNVADYLENANLTAANGTTPFVYEHRAGVPTAINDRVVVISP